jgi:hypothetical protein
VSLLGAQHIAGQRVFHGDVVRHAARQAHQAAGAGHQPPLDFRQAEPGRVRRHDQVARQRQLEAAGQLARRLLGQPAKAAARQAGALAFQEALQVHARAEGAARAGQDGHAQVVAAFQLVDGGGQRGRGLEVHGIFRLGPVHGDQQRIAVGFQLQRVAHAVSLSEVGIGAAHSSARCHADGAV